MNPAASTAAIIALSSHCLSFAFILPRSCHRRSGPHDGLLADGQVDQRRKNAQRNRDHPAGIVNALFREQVPAKPYAKKTADLMRKKHEAGLHLHMFDA